MEVCRTTQCMQTKAERKRLPSNLDWQPNSSIEQHKVAFSGSDHLLWWSVLPGSIHVCRSALTWHPSRCTFWTTSPAGRLCHMVSVRQGRFCSRLLVYMETSLLWQNHLKVEASRPDRLLWHPPPTAEHYLCVKRKIYYTFNPYSAGLILYKSWRPKGFNHIEIIINVLVISFLFIWIPMLWVYRYMAIRNIFTLTVRL